MSFILMLSKKGRRRRLTPSNLTRLQHVQLRKTSSARPRSNQLRTCRLSDGPINDTRNLFLFAFYCKGQRFETCVTLRRDQMRDGRIYFITNKGKDPISVKIHSRLQKILDQYPGDPFVFPFISELPAGLKE